MINDVARLMVTEDIIGIGMMVVWHENEAHFPTGDSKLQQRRVQTSTQVLSFCTKVPANLACGNS
jgi:hypothetical protein